MEILLDLDDTVIINGQLHPRFFDFQSFVEKNNHYVRVWSSHEDGEAVAQLMGFDYISKDDEQKPEADVLIDDSCDQFESLCFVDILCNSLEGFLTMVDIHS